ncbi:cytochrome-c peroxidase [Rhodobacteraceae bacterium NNCM2]|nr:cytochrome-c peroxidase [Coraliihabitans acroporae]
MAKVIRAGTPTLRNRVCGAGAAAFVLASAVAATGGPLPEENQPLSGQLPQPLEAADFLFDAAPPKPLFELGRALFFDPILSGNRNISCGTCHDPSLGTSDGLALSIGEGGTGFGPKRRTADGVTERIPRNAMALWNIGAREYVSMFHDGRVEPAPVHLQSSGFHSPAQEQLPAGLGSPLAVQAFFPVQSASEMAGQWGENPVGTAAAEGRLTGVWEKLAERLAAIPEYRDLFSTAFEDVSAADQISYAHVAEALAAFQTVGFLSTESPYDAALEGDLGALDPSALAGMELFYGEADCAECHAGPLLTDHQFHAIAVPQIGPGKGHGVDTGYWRETGYRAHLEDEGRYVITHDPADLFAFRTPSLRNVALTGPWGHDGAYASLEAMVRHHLDTVGSLEAYDPASAGLPTLDKVVVETGGHAGAELSPTDVAARAKFDLRDEWVHRSDALRARIARANKLAPLNLSDAEVGHLLAFLESLTDPTAVDRSDLVPESVPSGLTPQPLHRTTTEGD